MRPINSCRNRTPALILALSSLLVFFLPEALHSAEDAKKEDHDKAAEKPPKRQVRLFPVVLNRPAKLFCEKKYTESLQKLQKLGKGPRTKYSAQIHFLEGLNYFQLHNFQDAAHSLSRSRDLRRSNSDTLYFLAVSKYQLGKQNESRQLFQESVWFSRHSIVPPEVVLQRLAIAYTKLEKPEKAIATYQRALKANPSFQPARTGLATLKIQQGQTEEAVASLRQAITTQQKKAAQDALSVEAAESDKPEKEAAQTPAENGKPAEGCSISQVREIFFPANQSTPDESLLFVRALLMTQVADLSQADLEKALELVSVLSQDTNLPEHQRIEAQELFIRALLRSDELTKARTELTQAGKQFPQAAIFHELEKQLEIHEQAATTLKAEEENKTSS